MMKVYDMVTYGMYAPDESAPAYGYETPQTLQPAEITALALQTQQHASMPHATALPPSMQTVDIARFLESCGD